MNNPIVLPDVNTDFGALAHLIIAESLNPSAANYSANDVFTGMQAMGSTVTNRLSNKPSQFGAPGATTWRDIITAPGQFAGFTMDPNGKVLVDAGIEANIDACVAKANGGDAAYTQFVNNALSSSQGPFNDPFAGVTNISGTATTGGSYGWRTGGSSDPGGRFIAIPNGLVAGNQFYTLTA